MQTIYSIKPCNEIYNVGFYNTEKGYDQLLSKNNKKKLHKNIQFHVVIMDINRNDVECDDKRKKEQKIELK